MRNEILGISRMFAVNGSGAGRRIVRFASGGRGWKVSVDGKAFDRPFRV